jgi:hypothetical protein
MVQTRTAILFLQCAAEQAQCAHLGEDLAVEGLVAVGKEDARHQLVLGIVARGIAHHALLFAELIVEQQRVLPDKTRARGGGGGGGRLGRGHVGCPGEKTVLLQAFERAGVCFIPDFMPRRSIHYTATRKAGCGHEKGRSNRTGLAVETGL